MAPILYTIPASPPVRAVYLCLKAIDLDFEQKKVNLFAGEHLSPEFLKLNPQHTVPVLDDDGFILPDSHAIMTYLVSKYGKNDSLYPKDLKQRAIVDHRLHFDSSVLFVRILVISRGLLFDGDTAVNPKSLAALEEAYTITEKFLEKNDYIAGDHLTVADFSFVTSITTSSTTFAPLSEMKFPKIAAWIKRMQQLPYYREANQVGLDQYIDLMKDKVPK